MRSHYKRIGDYVTQIKLKNTDGSISSLKGININKHFMPSVANVNGTDLSKYLVVKKNQFAFNPMHVGRDEVLPISMLEEDEPIIVSPAYVVFEVKDEEELLPAYLMMWCRRSEFDRNAWFMTDNSVRGGFSWADFCDMELPVPSIEKQREIVCEYSVVDDRIALNEQLTQKLEDTAQAIYKQWFVDFEFPISKEYAESIGKPELEGKPYKSSGGEMEYCSILDMDKPVCVETDFIGDYVKLTQGQVINAKTNYLIEKSGIPLLRIQDLKAREEHIFLSSEVADSKIAYFKDIIVSRTGVVGLVFRHRHGVVHNNCFKIMSINEMLTSDFLFWFLKSRGIERQMSLLASGSVQADLSHEKFKNLPVILPEVGLQNKLASCLNTLEVKAEVCLQENTLLCEMKSVLLQKMSKG